MSSIISLKFSDKVQWFYFPFSPFFKSMAVHDFWQVNIFSVGTPVSSINETEIYC
jgi:hypothetical protein